MIPEFPVRIALTAALTMLLAAVSFSLVERPLRRWANERLEPGVVRDERLRAREAELCCPLHQDRYVVPDAAPVQEAVLLGDHVLNDRAFMIGEALGQPLHHTYEGLDFRFFDHYRTCSGESE